MAGFALSLSLILAIGAQNAFVLKQGLLRHHVALVCSLCALSDALLISAGVAGFGALIEQFPTLELMARYAGIAFLLLYSGRSFYTAWKGGHRLLAGGDDPGSPWRTALVCLAFTWLNPHVYLDTVFLIGSVASQFDGFRFVFAAGAITASFLFFFSLGYGARLLTPWFRNPRSWQVLDFLVGCLMLALATALYNEAL